MEDAKQEPAPNELTEEQEEREFYESRLLDCVKHLNSAQRSISYTFHYLHKGHIGITASSFADVEETLNAVRALLNEITNRSSLDALAAFQKSQFQLLPDDIDSEAFDPAD